MKSVLITGATSGIGWAAAQKFAQNEYFVHLLGRDLEKLKTRQGQLKTESHIWPCDITDVKSVAELGETFAGQFPQLDTLVHNAGVFSRQAFVSTSPEDWEAQYKTHVLGPVLLTQELLPRLRASLHPNIVFISSTLGTKPVPETSPYSAMKAAMINLSQSLALELAEQGVRVNCVNPGIVNTPIHDFHHSEDQTIIESMNQLHPLKRMGQPEEIAEAIYFLSSSSSAWTTGSVLTIDGGISLL